jgi:hypothetical protein
MSVQERTTLAALRNAQIVFKCLWRVVRSDLLKVSEKEYFFNISTEPEEHLENSKA